MIDLFVRKENYDAAIDHLAQIFLDAHQKMENSETWGSGFDDLGSLNPAINCLALLFGVHWREIEEEIFKRERQIKLERGL